MKQVSPKYSIILPVYNGIQYLPTCVHSILSQQYDDYELIISNDHSNDGTKEYLETLKANSRIKIIEPLKSLSMTEHWEWALSYASGEWMIFVGQDDGLQQYFFELADILIEIANEKGLRTIASSRAYYFWKGCEYAYGDVAVKYRAINKIEILNTKFEALKALFGFQDYFDLPQMYTTSLFKKSLIEEAKDKQGGKLFSSHPQDANLAAIACSLEEQYVKSFIPLGWVGTSPKSAGMAIVSDENKVKDEDKKTIVNLKKEYEKKVSDSSLKYHELAGSFSLGSLQVYFWQAFLKTNILRSAKLNHLLMSNWFRFVLLSFAYNEVKSIKKQENLHMMNEVIKKNNFNIFLVKIISHICKLITYSYFATKLFRRTMMMMFLYQHIYKYKSQQLNNNNLLNDISNEIKDDIDDIQILKNIRY